MHNRNRERKIIMIAGMVALLVLLTTLFFYKSIFNSNKNIESKIKALWTAKVESDLLIAEENKILELYDSLSKSKALIDADILKYIESLVVKTGMGLVDLRKSSQADSGVDYYNLRLEGKLDQFLMFEYLLYEAGALLSVDSYNIEKKDESLLDIKVVLENYVL